MRQILLAAIILFNLTAFAQEAAENLQPGLDEIGTQANNRDLAVPVLVKDGEDLKGGVISVEPSQQRPDALTILRQELTRQEMEAQAKDAKDGVFLSTTKRFTPESITFFIAMGGVTFNSMWIKSHGDPLAMERQIMSLKDPVSHISFYAFMQSQGFYMNFHTNRAAFHAMDASTKQQMMRRLSYQGMAVGSLASSIVADLGQSAKMCVDKWIKGKRDEQSLASCTAAWQQWTIRNKFTQYFPQIISMWASQAGTELVEHAAAMGFAKLTAAAWIRKFLTREAIVSLAYKITAADVVTSFVGGGWVTKSIKFVGKVTRFAGFLAVDHVVSQYTYRPINNVLKPIFFDYDALKINLYWGRSDAGGWDQAKMKDPKNIEHFEKEVDNFGKQMQQWRDHLNSDAESDLAGWMEMTKKLLNQADYAYKFYQSFADTMFETLNIGYRINSKDLAPSAAGVISRYPLRMLPLYGVKPGPYKAIGGQINDLYLLNPNELEKRQKEYVAALGQKYKNAAASITKPQDKATMTKIIEKLNSGDLMKMASGINDINQDLGIYDLQMRQENPYTTYSGEYIDKLRAIQTDLGDPEPVVYTFAGFAQAFTAYTPNFGLVDGADYSNWSIMGHYKFNKAADLMMYKLVCGRPQARIKKMAIVGVNITHPEFDPPSLLLPDPARDSFCSGLRTTWDLYSTQIAGQSLRDYILKHLDYSAIGDYRTTTPQNRSPLQFEKWWVKNAKSPISGDFQNYDDKFKKVFQVAYNNFFDHRNIYKQVVDVLNVSLYLPKSLRGALKAETSMYLEILNRTMVADNVATPNRNTTPLPGASTSIWGKMGDALKKNSSVWNSLVNGYYDNLTNFNYLEFTAHNGAQEGYTSMYHSTPGQISNLNNLFNQYYTFVEQPNLNFEQYIAHSKKMDEAINDALVAVGLKRIKTGPVMSDAIEDLTRPSTSGTENTAKEYEDVPTPNPTYKQRMAIASVKGLRLVEAEIRRFIRMRVALGDSLVADNNEILADWNQAQVKRTGQNTLPYGGTH